MADDSEISVRFGADTGDLAAGTDQVKEQLGGVSDEVDRAEKLFEYLGERMLEVFAIHEIAEFVDKMGELGEQALRSSAMTGIAVEEIQKLQFAATMTGGSAEEMTNMMSRLERGMITAQEPGNKLGGVFESLGIHVADLKNMTPDQVLMKIADAFAASADGSQKVSDAWALLGRSGAQMIPYLDQGSEGLKQLGLEAEETGSILTRVQAEGMEQTNQGLIRLKSAAEGAKIALFEQLKPAIDDLAAGFTYAVEDIAGGINKFQELQTVLGEGLVIACGLFVEGIKDLAAETELAADKVIIRWKEVGAVLTEVATLNWGAIADVQKEANEELDAAADQAAGKIAVYQKAFDALKTSASAAATAVMQASKATEAEGPAKPGLPSVPSGAADDDDGDESLALNDIATQEKIAQQKLQQQKDFYAQFATMGILSKQQSLELDKEAADQEYAIQLQALQQKRDLYDEDELGFAEAQNEILVLAEKHNTDIAKLNLQESQAQQQSLKLTEAAYKGLFDTIDRDMDQMLKGILQGTQTWQQAMTKLFDNLALSVIEDIAKMAVKWAAFEGAKATFGAASGVTTALGAGVPAALGGTQGGAAGNNQLNSAITALTAAVGLNTTSTLSASQIDALCNVSTAANTAATTANAVSTDASTATTATSTASSVGQMLSNTGATIANTAATIYNSASKAIPSFDVGTASVPSTGLALIHQGEMIIPADAAASIRSGSASIGSNVTLGGGDGGGTAGNFTININAIDTQTGASFLKANAATIASTLASQMRNNNSSLAGMRN